MSLHDFEECSNCGREIPRSEQAYVFENNIVCKKCEKKLRSEQRSKSEEKNPAEGKCPNCKSNLTSTTTYPPNKTKEEVQRIMANKYKVTLNKGKEKEEIEIEAVDELHATRMLALLNRGTASVDGMTLSCKKCKTKTFHKYYEGSMAYLTSASIFGMFILVPLLAVIFDRIVPEGASMMKILVVILFIGAFVICSAILTPLFLRSTRWTCNECGREWAP